MTVVDQPFLRDFADRWLDAWNSGDTDLVLSLLHPEIVWDERIFWPETLQGTDAVRDYVEAVWRAMPGYQVSEIQLFTAVDDQRALVFFEQSGAAPTALGTDRRFAVQGCDIFLGFADGLLSHYTATFEIGEMLRQLGALPPRGGLKGGAYLLSLAAASRPSDGPGAREAQR